MPLVQPSLSALQAVLDSLGVHMTDDTSDEILELIKQENDKQTKTFLLILYRMSSALEGNTHGLNRLSQDFDALRKESKGTSDSFKAASDVARGVKLVLVPVFSLIQLVVVAFASYCYTGQKEMMHRVESLEKTVAIVTRGK